MEKMRNVFASQPQAGLVPRIRKFAAPLLLAGIIASGGCRERVEAHPVTAKDAAVKVEAAGPAKISADASAKEECSMLVRAGQEIHRDEKDYAKVRSIDKRGVVLEFVLRLGFRPNEPAPPEKARLNFDGTGTRGWKSLKAERTADPEVVRLVRKECGQK